VISKENVRARHKAYGAAVYELYARTKKLQEQEREREREREAQKEADRPKGLKRDTDATAR